VDVLDVRQKEAMTRTLTLVALLAAHVEADQLDELLRTAEPPLLKVIRGDKPARVMDAEAGTSDAQRDLNKGELVIIRYDKPCVRVADWSEWDARFKRFGVTERPSMSPKVYCDAYNKVMDQALEKRFGALYASERGKLLPPPDAQPFEMKRQGEQGVAPQSATSSESNSECGDKPQTESKPRSR
jgi:hypothetical protein